MRNKLILSLTSLLILVLIWFLFIKKYDYQINFSIKTSPGTVFSRILEFQKWPDETKDKNIKTINKSAFKRVNQNVVLNNSTYIFNWNIKPENDSITSVKVYVKDIHHSFKQRILFLMGKSDLIKKATDLVSDFNWALLRHTEKFRLEIVGKSQIPAYQSLIYVTFSSDLPGKAGEMTDKLRFLTEYMIKYNVKKTGDPFMNIKHWDKQKNWLDAEFCFPVENINHYPVDPIVKIRRNMKLIPALKAVYHGNYRYTDRAWFALDNYAKQHNIKLENKVLEIYFNDPHNDANELRWKADVFIPLKN